MKWKSNLYLSPSPSFIGSVRWGVRWNMCVRQMADGFPPQFSFYRLLLPKAGKNSTREGWNVARSIKQYKRLWVERVMSGQGCSVIRFYYVINFNNPLALFSTWNYSTGEPEDFLQKFCNATKSETGGQVSWISVPHFFLNNLWGHESIAHVNYTGKYMRPLDLEGEVFHIPPEITPLLMAEPHNIIILRIN